MPPIRRYLRVTRYTVLEVRIHLDDPAQHSWLVKSSDPALPRVIAAIRPLVLPKLREESERVKGKTTAASKKRNIKDTVKKDDFEVSVFLTDSSTRHQLLTKNKEFAPTKERGTLRRWANGKSAPTDNDEDKDVVVIREESPDDENVLANIPLAAEAVAKSGDGSDAGDEDTVPRAAGDRPGADDKKMAPRTTYDGFAIYGRVLCLIVKRRGGKAQAKGAAAAAAAKPASSDQMMESWVSTQAARSVEQDGAAEAC